MRQETDKVWLPKVDGKFLDGYGQELGEPDNSKNWMTMSEATTVLAYVKGNEKKPIPCVPKWDFHDVEYEFSQGHEYDPVEIPALAEEMLTDGNYSTLEQETVFKLIKKHLGIPMGAQRGIVKSGSPVVEKDTRTHSDLADEVVAAMVDSIGCEGQLWSYNQSTGLYGAESLEELAVKIGQTFSGNNCKKLGDYNSIAKLVYNGISDPGFFSNAPYGIPCASNFHIIEGGRVVEKPYTKELRQRYKLPCDPAATPGEMFSKYLTDTLAGDGFLEQLILIQEVVGGLISGSFNKVRKAILLKGDGSNGKSVLLHILEHLIPKYLRCSISPSKFDDDKFRAMLAGKILNVVGELKQTVSLPSAAFKDIIACDVELTGREIYKSPFSFTPIAGHIFASNFYPLTRDHTHGFYNRWAIMDFHNTVADKDRVPLLGSLIVEKELPHVLFWAIQGAERLAGNNFKLTLSSNHHKAMTEWKFKKDSVHAFINDGEVVIHDATSRIERQSFWRAYSIYCGDSKLHPVSKNNFYERCRTQLTEVTVKGVRCFHAVKLKGFMGLHPV